MKKNLPVTQIETPVPTHSYLVSKTDLKGKITYVNDVFVEVSGFTREQLVGKNHNVVRHPDMPPQAFDDLWRTVKGGLPWRGLVKNRCSNGNHYWVDAFVVPMKEKENIVGYMSVRSVPSRQAIAEAEALYKKINISKAPINSQPPLFKRITLKSRLMSILALAVFLIAAGAMVSMINLSASNQSLKEAYIHHLKPSLAVSRMVERMGDSRAQVMLALQHSPSNSYSTQHDHPVSLHFESMSKNLEIANTLVAEYKNVPKSDAEIKLAEAFFVAQEVFTREAIKPAHQALVSDDNDLAQQILLGKINPLYRNLSVEADRLQSHLMVAGEQTYTAADQRYNTTLKSYIAGTLIAVIFLALSGYLLIRSIMIPLNRILTHFSHIAQGDLTDEIDVTGRDEVGRVQTDLACMQVNLKVMLEEIKAASRAIGVQSHRVEWQTASVVDQSEQQRDSTISTATATEEFSQSVQHVADAAGETSAAADLAQNQVSSAQVSMEDSVAASGRVVDAVAASSQTIQALNVATAKIGAITETIREIAEQTNLLALNAAIEAARAGEQGRGFAVVADEVRKLAERTSTSTHDIANMVAEVRKVTDSAIESMNHAVAEVESGIGKIRESGSGLSLITASSQRVTDMARGIAEASKEQAVAGAQVAKNMSRIASLVDGNLESAGQVQKAVRELVGASTELQELVARFKVIV